ncbi:NUDIX hydrolase [Pedobacter sp. SL55]|uniref:NUDIX hydrolase n=1 Tax=Pedobacter sp. SL55 TaxID=2995161 RepID=UPI00226E0BB6|nr:NUDIX domain-containing protein [Pedobacter sp. SL55]WAC39732.1 NUDIX domain-containing protein [Pedobacter sp. SL55]
MAQKYRIYINDNTLFITHELPVQVDKIQQIEVEGFDFVLFYEKLKISKKKNYLLLTKNPTAVFKKIRNDLTVIKAAGGLVTNAKGEFLFIFRNKKWDLPKGKVDKGEKVKDAAVREVEEECGVKIEKRNDRICKTYHVYEMGGELILKRTSWYHMTVKGSPKLVPQVEEGITEAVWIAPHEIKAKIKNTYALITDVLKKEKLV